MNSFLKNGKKTFKYFLLIIGLFVLSTFEVHALDNEYYENKNGIRVTKKEHDVIIRLYNQEYFDNMTDEDYKWLADLDINNNKVSMNTTFDVPNGLDSTEHGTASKKLTIIKSCSSSGCSVMTTATWLVKPTIRSYDVIGVRFNGTNFTNDLITTRVVSSDGVQYSDHKKIASNGVGCSVKLPETASNLVIDQKVFVTTSGYVFASYQHAAKKTTLEASMKYTLGVSGYGNVFRFYGDAEGVYDQMAGVDINLKA